MFCQWSERTVSNSFQVVPECHKSRKRKYFIFSKRDSKCTEPLKAGVALYFSFLFSLFSFYGMCIKCIDKRTCALWHYWRPPEISQGEGKLSLEVSLPTKAFVKHEISWSSFKLCKTVHSDAFLWKKNFHNAYCSLDKGFHCHFCFKSFAFECWMFLMLSI